MPFLLFRKETRQPARLIKRRLVIKLCFRPTCTPEPTDADWSVASVSRPSLILIFHKITVISYQYHLNVKLSSPEFCVKLLLSIIWTCNHPRLSPMPLFSRRHLSFAILLLGPLSSSPQSFLTMLFRYYVIFAEDSHLGISATSAGLRINTV